jgi:hypothetical protein
MAYGQVGSEVAETWGSCIGIGMMWSFWNFDRIRKIFNIRAAMSEVTFFRSSSFDCKRFQINFEVDCWPT